MQLPILFLLNRLFQTCIIVQRTCISIFSKIGLVDQSKPCAQIHLQKNCKLHKFATTNRNFLNRLFETCVIVKRTCKSIFSKLGLLDQSKTMHTNIFAKNGKLHKFATTNNNFGKINSFGHASS